MAQLVPHDSPATPPAVAGPSIYQAVDGIERRACSQALQFWRLLAAPRRYPDRTQVTPESAGDLWDYLFLVEVGPAANDYVFVYAGAAIQHALGLDPTGHKVVEILPPEIAGRSLYFQRTACDLMAPIDEAGKWSCSDGREVLYRSIVMPLSDDQRTANYLLGAFSFRIVRA